MTAARGGLPPFPAGLLPPGARRRARQVALGAARSLDVLDALDAPDGWGRCSALDARRRRWTVDEDLLDAHLLLPLVIATANGLPLPSPPAAPVPAPGGGWVAVDLGPDDEMAWQTLQTVLADEERAGTAAPDAEELARRAQEWRLAVTPYRCRGESTSNRPDACGDESPGEMARGGRRAPAGGTGPLSGVRIVDLTAMWAGPLATWLAGRLGAEVIRVEASCRPDGLRRGDRPAGADGPGALFVALDHGKTHHDLDLRVDTDRRSLEALAAGADVVVDSFSRRVRPNLGIDAARLARLHPGLIDVSLTAFPDGSPEADWVAYGGGVHAASGLAFPGPGGEPWPSPVPYADPLAGLELFRTIAGCLEHRRAGGAGPWRRQLSLVAAIAPLVGRSPGAGPGGPRPGGATDGGHHDGELAHWLEAAAGLTVALGAYRVLPCPLVRVAGAPGRPATAAAVPT